MWPANLERERRRELYYEDRTIIKLMTTEEEVRRSNGREKGKKL